jgi:hypothetical protein
MMLESSWWGLQLCFRLHLNLKFTHKIMGFQSCENPNFENFGSFRTKWHLNASPVALPSNPGRVESCEFVFAHGLSVDQKCSNYALTNLLFSSCKSMWIIDLRVTHHSPHFGTPTRTSTPKCCKLRNISQLLNLPLFSFFIQIWVYRGAWECVNFDSKLARASWFD